NRPAGQRCYKQCCANGAPNAQRLRYYGGSSWAQIQRAATVTERFCFPNEEELLPCMFPNTHSAASMASALGVGERSETMPKTDADGSTLPWHSGAARKPDRRRCRGGASCRDRGMVPNSRQAGEHCLAGPHSQGREA